MTKYTLSAVAILSFALLGAGAPTAEARGIHIRAGGVHVDIGHSHGSYRHVPHENYWGGGWSGWGSRRDWHGTSHLDYHPGGYRPHYNHFDYVPGHFDVHSSGHWDAYF